MRENNGKMLRVMIEQFSQFAIVNKVKGTFFSHSEIDLKGGTSSSSVPDNLRKVNAIITLRLGREVDNYMGDSFN